MRATLLVVDDEASIRLSLSQALIEIGYNVRCAEDGFSALRELRSAVPDLLLSDLNMPGISGFELLSEVRRSFPEIRTIAMSGSFFGNEVPSGVAADAYYQKGSSLLALIRIMKSLLPMEQQASRPSSPEAPLWIYCDSPDLLPDAQITITCPECERSFSQHPRRRLLATQDRLHLLQQRYPLRNRAACEPDVFAGVFPVTPGS
jgi:CheY-like chemotaxis protein